MDHDPLVRIAAALDRIAPPAPVSADALAHRAFVWRHGALVPARAFAPLPLDLLTGIDAQKGALVGNSRRLAQRHAAHDVLLWGARGAGKSALVKSAVGALQGEGAALALIEVAGEGLADLPELFALIADVARAFVLFIDDLGFDEGGGIGPRVLRSLLEGGAEARPANARLYVTSNRRHLVPRDIAEQDSAINPRDVVDDRLALADRFGLSLGFHVCAQATYVAMVERYAAAFGLGAIDAIDAIGWATARGSRSGRVAWQYVVELAGRQGRSI